MREKLSQQVLLSILTDEIDKLQITTKNINEIAPEIDRQLRELKTTKLVVEVKTDHLEKLLKEHQQVINSKTIIPKWFLYFVAFLILVILALFSFCWFSLP
ncbi:hypothetical protein [Mangrovibacterium diazotrophicum]|uniref:Uncharacterized protein n=1 Tax=Mangrovibacterium diazotrophicum TaxID=1261403 RepID=A0A419WAZ6_9BACT|nr:hypothetical protein [Mangrovibacterium diazotrophicum]RKD92645.1 hypothetical protein BC643_3020 [Mangrovibacterium diazotrophicum]